MELAQMLPAAPEAFLAVAGMALMMVGVFRGERSMRLVCGLAMLALAVAAGMVLWADGGGVRTLAFGGQFVVDRFATFMKLLVLIGAALSILLAMDYLEREQLDRFEYPILILFATLGMMMMISANDLLALYVGLETQSLSLYVLAAFRRDHARSSEAGLKYFVLGALSSGLLLYGISLLYGFAGTTDFDRLAALFAGGQAPTVGVIIGLVFVVSGIAFKVSAVPFHMWTPDVYEGAPTPVTAFFAAAPKVAAMALFLRVLIEPFGDLLIQWRQIVYVASVGSMALGAFAAIGQTNIKRLMAYSSIGNIGYALIGLTAGDDAGVRSVLIYMAVYVFMTIGTFAVILCMRHNGRMAETIDDLKGLSRSQPLLALVMAIFMFSLAGIPPLAGFFSKLYVFQAAIGAELYVLAIIGVLTSVVAAYYYLRIVKLMYVDELTEAFDRQIGIGLTAVLTGTGLFTLLFPIFQAPVLAGASGAALALIAR